MGDYRYESRDERVRKMDERLGAHIIVDHLAHRILIGERVIFNGEDAGPAQKFAAFLNSLPPEEALSVIGGTHDAGAREHIERMRKRRLTDYSSDTTWPQRRADR